MMVWDWRRMRRTIPVSRRSKRRRGFVLVTMALTASGVFGVVGLAIDIGRMFIVKNETQIYCDAAAFAAALSLDGTNTGMTRAISTATSYPDYWDFGTMAVTGPAVTFAKTTAGPWVSSSSPASGYIYVRVTATAVVPLYFLPLVVSQNTYTVVSTAVAGQVPVSTISRGLAPYTAVSTDPTGPTFGFTPGNSYDIQWPQYNSTRAHCGPANPDQCFNSPPCSGESATAKSAVVANWGASFSGYWGGSANSSIAQEILDVIQLEPVAVGSNLQPLLTSGNKASEAGYLDQRASQDANTSDNTVAAYLSSASHNGRRLIPITVVNPTDLTHTIVTGFGQFLLMANGSPSDYYVKTTNGNDPFCAVYVGPYNIGGSGPGAGGSTGASWVRLVE